MGSEMCIRDSNYIGSPIKAALEKDFGLPVTVANDANCMTLGEVWVGGAKGCWERYAATTALVRAAQEKNPAWRDGRAIFAAAEAGDKTVLALLDAWTDEIAQGLAGMVHIFNPQLILIGGGVSAQQKLLIEPIAAKVKASVMPAFAEGLEVRAAQLHNDAGMVGAVYYFRQTMEKE